MKFEFKFANNIPVITFIRDDGGFLGGDVIDFGEEVMDLINEGADRIAFDLRNISYINSFALGEMVGIRNYFLDKGLSCILILDNANIIKLFEMVGIIDLFETVSSENEF